MGQRPAHTAGHSMHAHDSPHDSSLHALPPCASDLLMYHIDDLEEIIACMKEKGRVSRREFQELVREVRRALGGGACRAGAGAGAGRLLFACAALPIWVCSKKRKLG